jgi:hypothetical protein
MVNDLIYIIYIFTSLMTRHGVWIGNWTYWALINRTYKQLLLYGEFTHCAIHYSTHKVFSVFFVFTRRCLITVPNTVDFSASVFTSILATDCLIAPHGCKSWTLTA